ncbi:hypothetical protein [Pseudophaeobacter leonis]|uniref:hypothetical protein n=1 Tax=Pseudophaeobacter leonis TaxID=1144477 RepID=UPI00111BF33C|nr:hypothetical protein [Pseudophaeobacter leonis]
MRSNYRNHLEHELNHLSDKERAAQKVASQDESTWKRAFSVAESFIETPNNAADQAEATTRESFRTTHKKVSHIRSERGEIEDELFRFGEDFEGRSSHQ